MNEVPKPICDQRYHKPNPSRICCEECCCHLTTSYLVGVRDNGGRHDRCSGRRHQGKHQSEENEELAHVSLTWEAPGAAPGEGGLGERPRRGH